jgi:hypothetical protein
VPPYEPLAPRARWTVVVLALVVAVDLAALGSGIAEHRLLSRAEAGEIVTDSEFDANDSRQAAVGLTQFALLIVAAFFFIRWLHRGYKNLLPLGAAELRFKPGWAIGAWFVPVLNLWRPKQIANDVWRGSAPDHPPGDRAWRKGAVPAVFALWWGLFLASNWTSQVALRLSFLAEEASEFKNATVAYLVSDATDLLAALAAIVVVRRTTARQDERARRLDAGFGAGS